MVGPIDGILETIKVGLLDFDSFGPARSLLATIEGLAVGLLDFVYIPVKLGPSEVLTDCIKVGFIDPPDDMGFVLSK